MKVYRVLEVNTLEPKNKNVLWLDTSNMKRIIAKIFNNGKWDTVEYMNTLEYLRVSDVETLLSEYAKISSVPTKNSQLVNDSKFVTMSQVFENCYNKSEVDTKFNNLNTGIGWLEGTGENSRILFESSIAAGKNAVSIGYETTAKGFSSYAEGYNTTANGTSSHAEGADNLASANYAHVEGQGNDVTGKAAHGEGSGVYAIGDDSHAEGSGTYAEGSSSHSEGIATQAIGKGSHAEGQKTVAYNDYMHVQGKYNDVTNTEEGDSLVDVIGWGSDEDNRKNIGTTDQEGNKWIAGQYKFGGSNYETGTFVAPEDHSSTSNTYGLGNSTKYGHLKLSDSITSTLDNTNGTAATPKAIKILNDKFSNYQVAGDYLTAATGVTGIKYSDTILHGDTTFIAGDGISIAINSTNKTITITNTGSNSDGENTYVLPTASSSVKGGIKVGSGLNIASEVLSIKAPTASTIGGVKAGTNITIATDGTISSTDTNTTYNLATTDTNGLMSAADKSKLDGLGGTGDYILPIASDTLLGGVKIGEGININNGVISVDNTTYSPATSTQNGLMSSTDKSKLDNIDSNANNYTLPKASSSALGGIKIGTNLSINTDGVVSSTNTTYNNATTNTAGLMSGADKSKLDGLPSTIPTYTLPEADASTIGGVRLTNTVSLDEGIGAGKAVTPYGVQTAINTAIDNLDIPTGGDTADVIDYYDVVIQSAADFNALSDTWDDAQTVAIIGAITLSGDINIPTNVLRIDGYKNATITCSKAAQISNSIGFPTTVPSEKFQINNLTINGYYFTNCRNLTNCIAGGDSSAFVDCEHLTNCKSTNTWTKTSFENCSYLTNCSNTGNDWTVFSACEHLTNCYGKCVEEVPSVGVYVNCNYITDCVGINGISFKNCDYITRCKGTGQDGMLGSPNGRAAFSECNFITDCVGIGGDTTLEPSASNNYARCYGGIGFAKCNNCTNCEGKGGTGDIGGDAFSNQSSGSESGSTVYCYNFQNCNGKHGTSNGTFGGIDTIFSTWSFYKCINLSNCGTNSSYTNYFQDCYSMQQCKGKIYYNDGTNCKSCPKTFADTQEEYASTNTLKGGWNEVTNITYPNEEENS